MDKAQEFEQLFNLAMEQPGIAEISQALRMAEFSSQVMNELRPVAAVAFTCSASSAPVELPLA